MLTLTLTSSRKVTISGLTPAGIYQLQVRALPYLFSAPRVSIATMLCSRIVANVVVFLASDQASYMTGQAINFTGGLVNW